MRRSVAEASVYIYTQSEMENEYRRKAQECCRSAEQEVDPTMKGYWLALSAQWLRLAEYVGNGVCAEGSAASANLEHGDEARLRSLENRLYKVQRFWNDEKAYADVVASGRYVKLCGSTGAALEALDEV